MALRTSGRRPTRGGWYIVETANVHWPGALPWRRRAAAERGQGYATEDEAIDRARAINAHYNARFGRGLPLAVRHLEGLEKHHRAGGYTPHREKPVRVAREAERMAELIWSSRVKQGLSPRLTDAQIAALARMVGTDGVAGLTELTVRAYRTRLRRLS